MVIDSGFRCHLTRFTRATAAVPSPFVTRLRKFLRTRRVTSVSQIGTDRIIEFQFSDGQYRLFLEFYAGGNIVLTDNELVIIALLRIVSQGPEQEELRVGLRYSLEDRQNYHGIPELTRERVKAALRRGNVEGIGGLQAVGKKPKKKADESLRNALSRSLNEFPPMLLDHALQVSQFSTHVSLEDIVNSENLISDLMDVLRVAQNVINEITKAPVSKGFIIAKTPKSPSVTGLVDVSSAQENVIYEDFHPFRPSQFEGTPEVRILEFEPFNNTVDEFFSSIESQKLESRLNEREENARRKLDAARKDHEKRLGGLQQVQELNVRKAETIEANLYTVQETTGAVNGLIAQGMDWVEIARLIEMEQAKQNPVAKVIKLPLKLYENTITLLLTEAGHEDEEDFEGNETGSDVSESDDTETTPAERTKEARHEDKRLAIDVDLALSPWSNACQYYDQKKSAAVKERKTIQSSVKALKSTERKVNADLKKGLKQEKQVMRPVRHQKWFEKFLYFISSEGYLVLGGRDSQQNDMLYKRYLRKGDIYVHADLQGAASIVIKNKPGILDSPIPPSTLSQAGTLAVATSSAWDSKAIMSAWWVKPDQVSQTAPTGEYLTLGAFNIHGQKNYLPPAQLLLGFGVMFQVSEESKARHLKHRYVGNSMTGADNIMRRDEASNERADGDVTDNSGVGEDTVDGEDDPNQENSEQQSVDGEGNIYSRDGHEVNAAGDNTLIEEQISSTDDSDRVESDRPISTVEYEKNEVRSDVRLTNPLQPHLYPFCEEDKLARQSKEAAKLNNTIPPVDVSNAEDFGKELLNSHDQGPPPKANEKADSNVRHLSAREHRLLRQHRYSTTEAEQSKDERVNKGTEQGQTTSQSDDTHEFIEEADMPVPKAQPSYIRGKHGKRNKQKTKYADQDEEDRILALRVLGSAAGQQKAAEDAAKRKAKEEQLVAQKERRRRQHALAVEKGKEAEESRRLNLKEGVEILDNAEQEGLKDLDAYVGNPLPGDDIQDALIMCGPWDAIGGRCRWRAKLQPGATKKGKAVREILGGWTAGLADKEKRKRLTMEGEELNVEEEEVQNREAELIRAIRESEVIGVVPVSKCRVILGGEKTTSRRGGGVGIGKGKRGGKGSKRQR